MDVAELVSFSLEQLQLQEWQMLSVPFDSSNASSSPEVVVADGVVVLISVTVVSVGGTVSYSGSS